MNTSSVLAFEGFTCLIFAFLPVFIPEFFSESKSCSTTSFDITSSFLNFKYAIICGLTISFQSFLDILNHECSSSLPWFSRKGTMSHLILIILNVTICFLIFFYALPQNNFKYIVWCLIVRRLCWATVVLRFLSKYASYYWNSVTTILVAVLATINITIEMTCLVYDGTDSRCSNSLSTFANILQLTASIIFCCQSYIWFSNKKFVITKHDINIEEYYCNVFVLLAVIYVILILFIQFIFGFPSWKQYSEMFLTCQFLAFSFHILSVSFFHGFSTQGDVSLLLDRWVEVDRCLEVEILRWRDDMHREKSHPYKIVLY